MRCGPASWLCTGKQRSEHEGRSAPVDPSGPQVMAHEMRALHNAHSRERRAQHYCADQRTPRQTGTINRLGEKAERNHRIARRSVATWKTVARIDRRDEPVKGRIGKSAVRLQIPRAVMAGR